MRPTLGAPRYARRATRRSPAAGCASRAAPLDAPALAMFADAWWPTPLAAPRAAGRRADDRPHGPLPRARAAAARRARGAGARDLPLGDRGRRLLRGGRRAVERATACCSPSRASSPCSRRSTGAAMTAATSASARTSATAARTCRPPSTRCPRHGVTRARVVVDLRHRPGRRDPRPAVVPQRLRRGSRPSSSPRRCSTPARRSSASSAATSRAASRHGAAADRRRPAAARRRAEYRSDAADAARTRRSRPALRADPAARARLRPAHAGRDAAGRLPGADAARRGRAARGRRRSSFSAERPARSPASQSAG